MFTFTRIFLTMLLMAFTQAGEGTPAANSSVGAAFILKSSAIGADGLLPQEFTGDGSGITPPLEWSGAPAGTIGYALIMSHLDPEGKIKWYWTLYQIPAEVTHLEKKSQDVGIAGLNSINDRNGYAPPHSKGPGLKYYVLTLYALSDLPKISVPNTSVTGAILSAAIKDCTVGTAVLKVGYDRTGKTDSPDSKPDQRRGSPPDLPSRSEAPSDAPRGDNPPRPTNTGIIHDTAIKKDGTSVDGKPVPDQARSFVPYIGKISLGFDRNYLYVRSDSLPDHRMMVGITAWQQQVPISQSYVGDNAWRIPLKPVVAKSPLSAKDHFFRGAIALAANGVPIFNPIKNDGKTDTLIAGELDEFGGHCGRADDYHYHTAPLHLQKTVGAGKPIAYALDGYPIYGLNEIDGTVAKNLDAFNGHADASGNYHYHATKTYPYLNGGFHGEVNERGGQVDPQPSASPIREAGAPLRGATITDFVAQDAKKFALTYRVNGQSRTLRYSIETNGTYKFIMPLADGTTKTEEYQRIQRGGGQGEGRSPRTDGPPPRADESVSPTSRSEHLPSAGDIVQGNRLSGERDGNDRAGDAKPDNKNVIKPTMADTIKVNVYADNWFVMYINGKLRAVDSIEFTPHNVVSIDILPEYPMTIAVMAKDNADPKTGLEYGDRIGDGGFSIKFSDGTVSNATWKAKSFFNGPLNHDTKNPKVELQPIPEKWWSVDFDDQAWAQAIEFTQERVKPKESYLQADFKGAKFIWSESLDLDNTVIFRTKIDKPGSKQRWNTKPDLDVSEAPLK